MVRRTKVSEGAACAAYVRDASRGPARGRARSRDRRSRAPAAVMRPVVHLVMPGLEVASAVPRPRETVAAFLRRTGWARRDSRHGWQFARGLPTILEVNGEAVLRADWRRRRIGAADSVRFLSFPRGGGGGGRNQGKSVIGLVALIAVAAFATFITGGGAAALLGASFGAGTFGAAALGAAIGLGGSLLINALTAPKAGATNTPSATQDQIYSVAAQGNTARLGQPLPVWYGRLKRYPEFAATPWGEFVANDQYLNVLLATTMGSLEPEALYIDDTLLWHAGTGIEPGFDCQLAFYEPGQTVTLFPVNVDQSAEVSGQQLPSGSGTSGGFYGPAGVHFPPFGRSPGAWLGGFAANPAGTDAQAIATDFVFPSGCYTYNKDDGNIGYSTVGLTAEYAPCDDLGIATGPYVTLFAIERSYAAQSPIRDSVKVDVSPGRYLVRFRREDAELSGQDGNNAVIWAGLRTFLAGANSFADVSTVALRIKASQSTQGSYKFGVLGTRKLPVWTGAAFATQATRNPGWAFLDAVVNAGYGSGLSISKVDFNAVVAFAAGCASRGDQFDYRFDTAVAVPEALDKILTVARARHFWLGDTVSIVRDEWRDVPSLLLTDREVVRDSTSIGFQMLGDEDPDAVTIEYIDETTWLPASVQYPPDDLTFTATFPEVRRIDGIVTRAQAFREAAFYYLASIYRRETPSVRVEYEGRAITLGSVLRLQSELPEAYGQGGAVTSVAVRTLTLDPAPVWGTGPYYIRLRRPNGTWFGPVVATQGADASLAVLDAASLASAETAQSTTLSAVLARADGAEDPSFEFGNGTSSSKLCVVLNGTPSGEYATLSLVVDDERVHATDLGSPPLLPVGQFPANDKVPLIAGLNANFGQGAIEPKLSASWFPAAGALYYIADVSYDDGVHWQQVYEGQDNQFSAVVSLAAVKLRVQAVNTAVRGPYSTVDVLAPTIAAIPQSVALTSLIEGLQFQVTTLQDEIKAALDDVTQRIAAISSNQDARNWVDKKQIRTQLFAMAGDAKAQIEILQQAMVDQDLAFASYQAEVSATFGPAFSSASTVSSAVAELDGYAAASWAVTVNVNGAISGIRLVNGSNSGSVLNFLADRVQISLPSVNGGVPYSLFTTGVVGATPSVVINGNLLANGTITAPMIQAGAVQAVHIQAGSISTTQLAVNGVDLPNIIDGAVSSTQVFATPAKTDDFSDFLNITTVIKSGKATIAYEAQWSNASFNYGGTRPFSQIDLLVDNVVVKSWSWIHMLNPFGGGSPLFELYLPISIRHTQASLANGAHNFRMRVVSTGARFSLAGGQVYITDFRR
ncbi:host specificity factor TipJ family phage tail protein [Bradyrhizobium oligotrophicum]|uniref:host specificity factor TipJ family phage tail protein n=1 Tax=Bradyrhizobium TaxID=374 RepID=UPI003EBE9A24